VPAGDHGGASAWVNDVSWGPVANLLGIVGTLIVLYFWFGDAIGESEGGCTASASTTPIAGA
jgi:hypothetical protein